METYTGRRIQAAEVLAAFKKAAGAYVAGSGDTARHTEGVRCGLMAVADGDDPDVEELQAALEMHGPGAHDYVAAWAAGWDRCFDPCAVCDFPDATNEAAREAGAEDGEAAARAVEAWEREQEAGA